MSDDREHEEGEEQEGLALEGGSRRFGGRPVIAESFDDYARRLTTRRQPLRAPSFVPQEKAPLELPDGFVLTGGKPIKW